MSTTITDPRVFRANLFKLADYLENEVHDIEYDHSTYGWHDYAKCALGHAQASGLFKGLTINLFSVDETFGPDAFLSLFGYYDPETNGERNWSRWDAIKAIRAFAVQHYALPETEMPEVYPPPARVMWERAKAEVLRILANFFRPLG